jgi:lysophospholipase L1-like esterase
MDYSVYYFQSPTKMIKFWQKTLVILLFIFSFQVILFAQNGYQRSALWEKEIQAFAELDKKEFPKTGGVLFVGSSSIRGWRTVAQDFPEFYTINRGFGGSHLEDVNFYAPQIVFPYKPKLIVLYAGENDLVAGKSIETVFNDLKKFVASVRQNLPKSRLIVVSVKPSPSRWEFTPKFQELNRLMKVETEKDKHLLFVDVWTPMLDENSKPRKEIFLGDRLHMNPAGYKIWRETLYLPIKKGLKGKFK